MARIIEDELVEPVARALLGAIDVDGGPTDEQRNVLQAIVAGYWGRADLDVGALVPLSPAEAADAVTRPDARRRVRELLVQLAIADTDVHWLQLLGNLGVHEAGYLVAGDLVPKEATLARLGATDTVAHAMWRGAQCTGDFTGVDHLGMAHRPLEDMRAEFGVPPRAC